LHWNIEQCVELKLHLFFIIVLLEPWLTHRATNWLSVISSIQRSLILALAVITHIKFNISSQAVFVSDSIDEGSEANPLDNSLNINGISLHYPHLSQNRKKRAFIPFQNQKLKTNEEFLIQGWHCLFEVLGLRIRKR